MNSRIYLVILFVVLSCSLSYTNTPFRIVNGEDITMQDSPSSVAIYIFQRYRCVGTLVTLKSVVTAANCVFDVEPENLVVLAGKVDANQLSERKGYKHTALRIYIDPDFRQGSLFMDIAVVIVRCFKEIDTVKPAPLCDSVLLPNTDMKVSGWGSKTLDGNDPYYLLRRTEITTIEKDQCQSYLPYWVPETIICCGGIGKMGFGDSGAGAIVDNKLCAVAHSGCKANNIRNLFTNVTNERVLGFLNFYIEK